MNEIQTDFGCWPNDLTGFVSQFYGTGIAFIGGLALIIIIWGGYTILTSQGDPNRLNAGRSYIYYAIAGLLLAIFGYVFFEFIGVNILHLPGLGK